MKRLLLAIFAFLWFPGHILLCDWRFPFDAPEWNEYWDILRHQCLFIWGISIACIILIKGQKYDQWVKAIMIGMILGMIIPCIIDTYRKDRIIHLYDYIFAILGIYSGLYYFVKEWHKKIGVSFITLITLGLYDSDKLYIWLCQKLK